MLAVDDAPPSSRRSMPRDTRPMSLADCPRCEHPGDLDCPVCEGMARCYYEAKIAWLEGRQ